MAPILIVISVLFVLGIIYTLYSISTAEEDNGHLDEEFGENSFVKPPGWKEGKMPLNLQRPVKIQQAKIQDEKKPSVFEMLWSKLCLHKSSKT